jgi:hypothetical protein
MMKRLAALLAGITLVGAAPTTRSEIASRAFLLGTWRCTFTVGDEAGNYTTTWSLALGGLWLKQTYDQPKQPRAQPFKAEYFVGYDEDRGQWVRFGAMTTGQYFTIRMTDTGSGGWGWRYVSLFPVKGRAASGYDTVFTHKSDTVYAVDGPTYRDESGATVTEHHVCRKSDNLPRPIS